MPRPRPAGVNLDRSRGGREDGRAAERLKSLFKVLKGHKLVFTPRRHAGDPRRGHLPLALDPAVIRAELSSPNPAIALAVALVAFHAPSGKQIRELMLTDIADGRLLLGDRVMPLAATRP